MSWDVEFIGFGYFWVGLRSMKAASYCIDSLLSGECLGDKTITIEVCILG